MDAIDTCEDEVSTINEDSAEKAFHYCGIDINSAPVINPFHS